MTLTEQQNKLLDFVKQKHGDQKRKYTGEPYWNHLVSVAEIISQYEENCVEIALCHDLFEDTNCNFTELYKKLVEFGYEPRFAYEICTCVIELTDKFISKEYPYLNREKRKRLECERLSKISYKSQSVKYADLIDNTKSIVGNDKKFGEVYLREKAQLLKAIVSGNKRLFELCKESLELNLI